MTAIVPGKSANAAASEGKAPGGNPVNGGAVEELEEKELSPPEGEKDATRDEDEVRLEEGMEVEARYRGMDNFYARYRGMDNFYPGVIRRDNRDGTYEIEYDDGSHETRVPAKLIKGHVANEVVEVTASPPCK